MIWKSLKRDHRNKQQLLRVTNVIAHGAWDQTPQRVRNSKHQWGTRSTLTAAVYPSSIWLHGRGGTNAKVPSCYWPGQPGKGTPHEEGSCSMSKLGGIFNKANSPHSLFSRRHPIHSHVLGHFFLVQKCAYRFHESRELRLML